MFDWKTYRDFYHPIEELSFFYTSVILLTLLTMDLLGPNAAASTPDSFPLSFLLIFSFAGWSWVLTPFLFPVIRSHLIRRNLSGIGLDKREMDYAILRHLLTVEDFYFHIAYELEARGDKFRENDLKALAAIDDEHLIAVLRKAMPESLMNELDDQIRRMLACKKERCKCNKR